MANYNIIQLTTTKDSDILWEPNTYYAVTSSKRLYIQTGTTVDDLKRVEDFVWEISEGYRMANALQIDITEQDEDGSENVISPIKEYPSPVLVYVQDSNRLWRYTLEDDIWDLIAGSSPVVEQTTNLPYNCIQCTELYLQTMIPRGKSGTRYCTTDTKKILTEMSTPYHRQLELGITVLDDETDLESNSLDTTQTMYVIETDDYYQYNIENGSWESMTNKSDVSDELYSMNSVLGADYAEVVLSEVTAFNPIGLDIDYGRNLNVEYDATLLSDQLVMNGSMGSIIMDAAYPINSILSTADFTTAIEVSAYYYELLGVVTAWEYYSVLVNASTVDIQLTELSNDTIYYYKRIDLTDVDVTSLMKQITEVLDEEDEEEVIEE